MFLASCSSRAMALHRGASMASRIRFGFAIKKFYLPDLGEKIKEAVVQKWLVKEGEEVEEFQNLADVSTDKLFTQIPATSQGKIHKLHIAEGSPCQVGSLLLEIDVGEETVGQEVKKEQTDKDNVNTQPLPTSVTQTSEKTAQCGDKTKTLSTPAVREYARQKNVDITLVTGTGPEGRVTREDIDKFGSKGTAHSSPRIQIGTDYYEDMLATAAVRSFAKEQGVDITKVKGSAQHGRILKEDIMNFKESSVSQKPQVSKPSGQAVQATTGSKGNQVVKMNQIMQGMVKSMNHAATVPHFYLKDEFDVTRIVELREKVNAGKSGKDKISMFSFIIKAFSVALRDFPMLNSTYSDDKPYEYTILEDHNVSVAIDTPNGLMAPNLKRVQTKSIRQIQQDLFALRALAEQAKLGQNELFGGSIALSNIGSIGGTYAGPLNLPGQACIVGIGRIRDTPAFAAPVKVDGKTLYDVQMRKVINVSFGCDHRVLDGATVARFSNRWKDILENPEQLIVELQ